jgi:cell division protein FtsB
MAKKPTKLELLLEDVPAPIRNKFIVVTALFVIWMFFFDSNSIISQYRLQATLQELQSKEAYYEAEISQAEKDNKELFTDDKTREKFAREHYYMKKADEDVFIIQK